MAETVEGGRYLVGDKFVNANGEELKGDAAKEPAMGTVTDPALTDMRGLFASDAAFEAAIEAGLNAAEFKGGTPSSPNGYTKPDVQALIDARAT